MNDGASPWYKRFFAQDYLDIYGPGFTPERDAIEAGFAAGALGLRKGARVLDLCCGQGRHAVLLAQQGYAVTGLDLSEEYLALCKAAARAAGVEVATVAADMRDIPFADHFDAVVNLFSSFGYLESEAEDAKVLQAVARSLKPGGRFLIDLLNREWVIANQVEDDSHSGEDGTLYLEHRSLDLAASRNHITFTAVLPDGSRREVVGHHIRLYTLRELIGMLEAAGLDFETAYGGYDGQPYGASTRRLIAVARRP
jgi:SAM-dependent methyltransferase